MFQRLLRFLGTDRGISFVCLMAMLAYGLYLMVFKTPLPWRPIHYALFVSVPLGLAYGICLYLKSSWARPIGMAFFGWFLLVDLRWVVLGGFHWSNLVSAPCVAYGIWLAWKLDLHEGEEPAGEEEAHDRQPLTSLVLLQKELPHLEAVVLARLASQAWGIPVTSNDGEEDNDSNEDASDAYIVGQTPLFMCSHPAGTFMMNVFDRPYWDEDALPKVAAEMQELRARLAIERHTAWLSIDLMFGLDRDDVEQKKLAYQIIGRFLAAIADDNTLAVVDPEEGRLYVYDPETEAKLKSDDPLASLREQFYAPVVTVADDDPEMMQAVQEAKDRWPEFVAAFESRTHDGPPCIIKAPFTEGDKTEFMWAEVTGIENGLIYGILKNDPADLPGLREGSHVTVKEADVNDWLYIRGSEPLGAFTMKVLAEKMKPRD